MAPDYEQLMEDLRTGKRESFSVDPDNFMAFHDAYMSYEYRKRIIGMAGLDGHVIYHFDKDGKATN
ncbi:hypothetical protein [Lactiplantibacillus fabifermentans]|uniref:Uncharacterized protein n=2 Tax=Lactiplantibacillus fabifermentans TaxID=483011 RepID=A0A0R2NEQ6_9LACO|nr:hypothetical protein [Lactiplantibacillus fabifermentans]ETY74670.1 hypothetical protein LFAB_05840 [Lactiplantibacillus fabifermentans T30PCM01]KRO22736.1 hypothetical protein DY78_GL001924 [Lactiplantibacillus fabifermentans DSM 21115]